ncbi:hypothetical protein [Pleurocapsa sp. FMAR1]|uniref:hypothetical protein n=1 Tax=Pleurocapsa sp. FMAR1 TaxID=3040204 RepID=UPI0029C7B917|nr:hypothetical protein [Pleurocapsa sp. FMAR1]
MKTQNEIIEQGYKALVDSLGVVDAIRFIQHFSPGEVNYTEEHYQWLKQKSLNDVFQDIEQLGKDNLDQYQKVIE